MKTVSQELPAIQKEYEVLRNALERNNVTSQEGQKAIDDAFNLLVTIAINACLDENKWWLNKNKGWLMEQINNIQGLSTSNNNLQSLRKLQGLRKLIEQNTKESHVSKPVTYGFGAILCLVGGLLAKKGWEASQTEKNSISEETNLQKAKEEPAHNWRADDTQYPGYRPYYP